MSARAVVYLQREMIREQKRIAERRDQAKKPQGVRLSYIPRP